MKQDSRLSKKRKGMFNQTAMACAKRLFDLVVGSILLLAFCPVLVLVGVAVGIILGQPVIFSQERTGLHCKAFQLYKFRTMTCARDEFDRLLPDRDRMTSFGKLLRRFSLDELPQFWNVLNGEMSLVGPRPLLPEYLPRYTAFQCRRHEAKPGITGWAQINGRNAITWEEKFDLDVWYVDHSSLWLDIRILWLTLAKVLRNDGISQNGEATMQEFRGTTGVSGKHD